MAYQRKTEDEWQLHVNYGHGWEHELSESTYKEARQRLKDYRDNCPQCPTKLVKRRVRIGAADA